MNRLVVIVGSILGAVLVGVLVGFGAIKIYQAINPVDKSQQSDKKEATAFVDPVKSIRELCTVGPELPTSQLYGNVSRPLTGETREATTFSGIARVMHTNPVVLGFDTASVKPVDSPLFDANVRQIPIRVFTVTDSAAYGLNYGDIIKASVEYSAPKPGQAIADAKESDLEVAVKLQNSLLIDDSDTAKQGIFAKNFTLFALPAPFGLTYMASGDNYTYGVDSETASGLSNVTAEKVGDADAIAAQLAKLGLYSEPLEVKDQSVSVVCGRAISADKDPSESDKAIMQNVMQALSKQ